jgi:hypothetical protein
MKARRVMLLGALAAMALATVPIAAQAPAGAQAQNTAAYKAPRTPWGHPDLQGVWANNNATSLERPKEIADKAFLTDEEVATLKAEAARLFDGKGDAAFGDAVFLAAIGKLNKYVSTDGQTGNYQSFWIVGRDFDNRTSLVLEPDGRIPPMTPEAQKKVAAVAEMRRHPPAGPESLTLSLRCISFGLPNTFAGYNSNYQFIQTPDYVAIVTEMIHDPRIIPLDNRPHVGSNIRQWLGDSRGHWERDTLVVDTTNFVDQSNNGQSSLRISGDANMHLTERFTRVNDNTIQYEFTIDDPTMWIRTWKAMIPLRKIPDQIYEYACHEGNYGMPDILGGARVEEEGEVEAAKTGSR